MKKRVLIAIVIGIVAIVGVVIAVLKINDAAANRDFISVEPYDRNAFDGGNYVFTTYDDYHSKIKTGKLTAADFENNNYVLFSTSYNSCTERNMAPADYEIMGSDIEVTVIYEHDNEKICSTDSNCVAIMTPSYYLLRVDKNITFANVDVIYIATNISPCVTVDKPLIYLYPQEETSVVVRLGHPELLTSTYPKYTDGWEVVAKPDGELIDASGRTYYGLYWEGISNMQDDFDDGFVVSKDETIAFLEEKLAILGLTEREANEFIIYWLPRLEENEYNLIRFEDINSINEQMPLDVQPAADTVIRVLMRYKPLDSKINIKEQELTPAAERRGFTVVEWGGSLVAGD